jgi:hypothetical protein
MLKIILRAAISVMIFATIISCSQPGNSSDSTPALIIKLINFPKGNHHGVGALINDPSNWVAYSTEEYISNGSANISSYYKSPNTYTDWTPTNGVTYTIWFGVDMNNNSSMADPGDYDVTKVVTVNGSTIVTIDGTTDLTQE